MAFKYRGRSRQILIEFPSKTVKEAAEVRVRAIAIHGLQTAYRLSPYRTGAFIASWRLGVNVADPTYAEPGQRGREIAVAESLTQAIGVLNSFKLGQNIILSNSVPYAGFVEYGSPTTQPRYIGKRIKASITMKFKGR